METILKDVQQFIILPSKTVGNIDSNVQLLDITEDSPQLQNVVQSQSESYTSWSTNVSKRLLSLYKSHHIQIGITIKKQKNLWEIIAEILNKEFHLKLTASQVENKWRTLLRAYKNVTDNNNKTGRGRKVFEYQEEMDLIFANKKNINPEVLLSNETIVNIPKSTSTIQNSNEEKEHNLEGPSSSRSDFLLDTPTHSELPSELPIKHSEIEQRKCIRKRILSRNDVLEKIRLDRQKQHEQIIKKMEERTQLQRERLIERKRQNDIQEGRNGILRELLKNNVSFKI